MSEVSRSLFLSLSDVNYTCPFVPAEWIAAHGLKPNRIRPSGDSSDVRAGLCPYVHRFLQTACGTGDACAVVVTTVCDQMRRGAELIRCECDTPLFLMNVLATWQNANAWGLYRSELVRFGRFLEGVGGVRPSKEDLAECMVEYEAGREVTRAARLDAKGVPVALLGGPMTDADMEVFRILEKCGGGVVLDGTEDGERTLPARFNRRGLRDDPVQELVDAYFGSIPDPFRRPNSMLYMWLKESLARSGARGVILLRHVWCDNWHAEVDRLRDWLEIPLVDVVLGAGSAVQHRIEAFVEAIG